MDFQFDFLKLPEIPSFSQFYFWEEFKQGLKVTVCSHLCFQVFDFSKEKQEGDVPLGIFWVGIVLWKRAGGAGSTKNSTRNFFPECLLRILKNLGFSFSWDGYFFPNSSKPLRTFPGGNSGPWDRACNFGSTFPFLLFIGMRQGRFCSELN